MSPFLSLDILPPHLKQERLTSKIRVTGSDDSKHCHVIVPHWVLYFPSWCSHLLNLNIFLTVSIFTSLKTNHKNKGPLNHKYSFQCELKIKPLKSSIIQLMTNTSDQIKSVYFNEIFSQIFYEDLKLFDVTKSEVEVWRPYEVNAI